ncbi:hypothetical protein [Salipiger sp. PrR003]|nr:hypothetical protein [Salipiger sp. PrR003]NDV52900.1 hypothetical protein [Salipiger sp. PrR003]
MREVVQQYLRAFGSIRRENPFGAWLGLVAIVALFLFLLAVILAALSGNT